MTINIEKYLNEFKDILFKIQVTFLNETFIDISEGTKQTVEIISNVVSSKNKIILIGNGGSSSIANHIAVDLWKNGRIKAISFSDSSLLTCVGNDFGFEHIFEKPIEMFANDGDVLIAISSSGRSENILNGVKVATRKRCKVITMSGFEPNNPLRKSGNINFYIPSNSYGYVEIAHSILCHFIADVMTSRKLG